MPKASDKFQKPMRADILFATLGTPDGGKIQVDLRQGYTPEKVKDTGKSK